MVLRSMIRVVEIEVTPFAQLARLLIDEHSKDAVIVDPGGDSEKILAAIAREGVHCRGMWVTHSHLDHCGGVAALKRRLGLPLCAHAAEREMRGSVESYAELFGIGGCGLENCPEPDTLLCGGEELAVGASTFKVLFAPGHSPGHLCFYSAQDRMLLAGDVIFAGSIGRTDLPGGSMEVLLASIRETILTLPDETRIYPGHGPSTTVGREKVSNPFLQS